MMIDVNTAGPVTSESRVGVRSSAFDLVHWLGLCPKRFASVLCLVSFAATFAAFAAEPAVADYKHLGVGSCATSVCHGKLAPQPGKNVALNEYRT